MRRLAHCREGTWFSCHTWWVYPRALEKQVRDRLSVPHNSYNGQLEWVLAHAVASDKREARWIVIDFLRAVRHASAAFGEFTWFLFSDFDGCDWRKHAWKHVTYRNIQHVGREVYRPLDPEMRLDHAGIDEESLKDLIERAREEDAEAVSKLSSIFPYNNEIHEALRLYVEQHDLDWDIEGIPSAGDLAKKYTEIRYKRANLAEIDFAESKLKVLSSEKASAGQKRGRGRLAETLHPEPLWKLFLMSQALFLQLRAINDFISLWEPSSSKRNRFLRRLYPWVRNLPLNRKSELLTTFLKMQPTNAAYLIMSTVLDGLSTSKIEKALYSRSHKHPHI